MSHALVARILLAIVSVLALPSAHAADGSRTGHRFGVYVGLLGDPFPTLIGYNIAFNATSFLRFNVGYGSVSAESVDLTTGQTTKLTATTIGGGARAFLVPSWNFSPVVGLGFGSVTVSGSGSSDVGGFSASGSHLYASGGFDWQADGGFNLGFGLNYSLKSGVGSAPYINLGWFF